MIFTEIYSKTFTVTNPGILKTQSHQNSLHYKSKKKNPAQTIISLLKRTLKPETRVEHTYMK